MPLLKRESSKAVLAFQVTSSQTLFYFIQDYSQNPRLHRRSLLFIQTSDFVRLCVFYEYERLKRFCRSNDTHPFEINNKFSLHDNEDDNVIEQKVLVPRSTAVLRT